MDLKEILEGAAAAGRASREAFERGMDEGRCAERKKFEAVIKAYDRALQDDSVRIPTYMHAALECARAEWEKINRAAEQGIRKDQRERYEGRAENDQDTVGRRLKAGS